MEKYTIYCTEEQTKKALELGAPIEVKAIEEAPEDWGGKAFLTGMTTCAKLYTAEQMIGWLEERGIWIHFCKPYQRPELLSFSVSVPNKPFKRAFIGSEFASRKEATLAAIDAALDYLKKMKE